MASKKTESKKAVPAKKAPAKKAAAPKAEKKAASEKKPAGPRHPKARVIAANGGKAEGAKEAIAKTLAAALVRGDESADSLATKLKTASNSQLLRLQTAVATMQKKFGSRDKLVAAAAGKQSKDKDFVAKLEKLSVPNLLDLAANA
ncbi:MAG: hypothetical protein QM831_34495 [Kofleriaceae bacterium]